MRAALLPYRVMATVVGILLIVLVLIGVPLANFDGTSMWGIFPSTPATWPEGSTGHEVGQWITHYLGVTHGWLYMIFLITAFVLSRKADWDLRFTAVTLVSGTIPILSFWAERRATRRVQDALTDASDGLEGSAGSGPGSTGTGASSTRAG